MCARGRDLVSVATAALLLTVFAAVDAALLDPIATSPPSTSAFPPLIHAQQPQRLASALFDSAAHTARVPLPTNKYWGNVMVGSGASVIPSHPYLLRFTRSSEAPFGMLVSHSANPATGPIGSHGAIEYYLRATSRNLCLGATEYTVLPGLEMMDTDQLFGVTLRMWGPNNGWIEVPVVRGMAYVTGTYNNLSPLITTEAAILSVNSNGAGSITSSKFKVALNNGQTWLIYAFPAITLQFANNRLTATAAYSGTLRAALLPSGNNGAEAILDARAPVWITGGKLETGVIDTSRGWYSFVWRTAGDSSIAPLHFAFPHHLPILDRNMATVTGVQLISASKGTMTAVIGAKWVLRETGLTDITWLPPRAPSAGNLATIQGKLRDDLWGFPFARLDTDSFYYAGKYLQKLGMLCLMSDSFGAGFSGDTTKCVNELKTGFNRFVGRTSTSKLGYDRTHRGVIRTAGAAAASDSSGADFGNAYYNDHHFHFGYFVVTAAILRHLDPSWVSTVVPSTGLTPEQWITTLIRDVANPSTQDTYFPQFRAFDWFAGHSWANGIFEIADGKDEESTSEEVNMHYGLTMWGLASDKPDLYKLGNLMFAVSRRSINAYFLMTSTNQNHPANFIANKVTGIAFETKVHHTKWFAGPDYCVHGIQMLPVLPITELVRYPNFVREEWSLLNSASMSGWANDGWGSLLLTNYATINAADAFARLLAHKNYDDGLTMAWALYFADTRPDPNSVAPPADPNPTVSWPEYSADLPKCTSSDVLVNAVDLYGSDIANADAATIEECIALCKARDGCSAVTLAGGKCYMKSAFAATNQKPCAGCVSAYCISAAVPKCATMLQLPAVDLYGSDISSAAAANINDCVASCQADAACKTATFANNVCYLKTAAALSNQRYCAGCVSAYCAGTEHCPNWVTAANTDLYGGDIVNSPGADIAACASACSVNAGCVAATHYQGVCYLKGAEALTSQRACIGCTSGKCGGNLVATVAAAAPASPLTMSVGQETTTEVQSVANATKA